LLISAGPTLVVDIGFDDSYDPGSPDNPPNLPVTQVPALIDTGASQSCIDKQLAETLQLPIVDEQQISGVSGLDKVNMHLAHIYVP